MKLYWTIVSTFQNYFHLMEVHTGCSAKMRNAQLTVSRIHLMCSYRFFLHGSLYYSTWVKRVRKYIKKKKHGCTAFFGFLYIVFYVTIRGQLILRRKVEFLLTCKYRNGTAKSMSKHYLLYSGLAGKLLGQDRICKLHKNLLLCFLKL